MSQVLIFGGSGFLGAQVLRALSTDNRVERVTSIRQSTCDLINASVDEIADRIGESVPTAVVNCTGRLDGTTHELMQANALVTAKLLDALSGSVSGSAIRFVRIGSAGEYGLVPYGTAVVETDQARPVSAYRLSHLTATGLVELAASHGRVDGLTLRVLTRSGPGCAMATYLAEPRRGCARRLPPIARDHPRAAGRPPGLR